MIEFLIASVFVITYFVIGGIVGGRLRVNYELLVQARKKRMDDDDIGLGASMGGVFWPVAGLPLLIQQQRAYGITQEDRRRHKLNATNEIRDAIAERQEEQLRQLERKMRDGG